MSGTACLPRVRDEGIHLFHVLDRADTRIRVVLRPSLLRPVAPPEYRPKPVHRIRLENLGINRESENPAQGIEVVAAGLLRPSLHSGAEPPDPRS